MKIKTALVAGVFVLGAVAAGTGVASAEFIGNYATYEACAADGNSPRTGGTEWQCVEVAGGWDLHTF
ncbi:hypothetical protein ACFQZZ_30255 [Nocardia sp. GCM10030253]|uniref:hypothetical protein n=1 Tax=Nocardia sp. GCM10030253 TaxID=3273404 RepID=UPI0036368532